MKKLTIALDVETYSNYFLVVCKSHAGRTFAIEKWNDKVFGDLQALKTILNRHGIVTFNGTNYDLPMIGGLIAGYSNAELKQLSDDLITRGPWWRLHPDHPKVNVPKCDHIDLFGVTPLQKSLKAYMCRIHAPTIQDLPLPVDAKIDAERRELLRQYCENDVDGTLLIYDHMRPQLELRATMSEYGDMRSKSDPQIAETIIRSYLNDHGVSVTRREDGVRSFRYRVPEFIRFKSPELRQVGSTVWRTRFDVADSGKVNLPDSLKSVISFGGAKYKLGIGGLHSQEKAQVVLPTADQIYGEFDVASMYPSIILGQGLYPDHIGSEFVTAYRSIFTERMTAKTNGQKTVSDTLKIVLNSSYGKFGSPYSFLYSPELLIQTTITGQLALLMLIERLTDIGCRVMSANTDGVNVLMARSDWDKALDVTRQWSADTSYQLEWNEYKAQYSASVNSYVAFSADGKVKSKGIYESGGIHKGYAAQVSIDAAIAYLRDAVPLKDSLLAEKDVRAFLTMREVRGGAVWRDQVLGKVVRWYQSKDGDPIHYVTNGNKVAGSDGARPMMTLVSDLPADLDYHWYLTRAIKLLKDLGVPYEDD